MARSARRATSSQPKSFFDGWVAPTYPVTGNRNFVVCREHQAGRNAALASIATAIKDHLVRPLNDIAVWQNLPLAAQYIKNSLPTSKKIRSGDLGEIIATEYAAARSGFQIPIKRLRFKDDRNTSMRGDDVIGIQRTAQGRRRVLKVESKSRVSLAAQAVLEADEALMQNFARPNPSTLAFISKRLRDEGRVTDAALIEAIQLEGLQTRDVEHLLFTFSGNDPTTALSAHVTCTLKTIRRHAVGIVIADHQEFIRLAFEAVHA